MKSFVSEVIHFADASIQSQRYVMIDVARQPAFIRVVCTVNESQEISVHLT